MRKSRRPMCRNLGSCEQFLVKVILIDFQLGIYMQFKEKDVYNFFSQYWRHSDVTKWGTVLTHKSKSLNVLVLFTPTIIVF